MNFMLDRRSILRGGFAGLASAICPPAFAGVPNIPASREWFVRPFSSSLTVTRFVLEIWWYYELLPSDLMEAISSELERTDVTPDSLDIERKRAEFFADLAVHVIAPHYLRMDGFEELAASCENERDLKRAGRNACLAQHAVARLFRRPLHEEQLIPFSTDPCSHAAHAVWVIENENPNFVASAGMHCGRAIFGVFRSEDPTEVDFQMYLNMALKAANTALLIT